MNTQLSPILVTIKDAANLLSVCPRTVQNLIVAKKLKVRKVGRRSLLNYRELLAFAQHDHTTTAQERHLPSDDSHG
jgi:excisionase family DNA binding protein